MSRLRVFSRFPGEDPVTVACAVHQSGHLVMATLSGFRVVCADLMGCAGESDWHLPIIAGDVWNEAKLIEQCRAPERLAEVRLAGPAALRLVGWGVEEDAACGEDERCARYLLGPFFDSEGEVETAIRRLDARVTSALLVHLEAIYRLAGAFLKLGILAPCDVAREFPEGRKP